MQAQDTQSATEARQPEGQEELDPLAELLSWMRRKLGEGDLMALRQTLIEQMNQAPWDHRQRLSELVRRLNVDRAALIILSICGVGFFLIVALTLFH